MQTPKTQAEAVQLLVKRIEQSGLNTSQFARQVLLRDGRTVRRWLASDNPIPAIVMDFLVEPWVIPWPKEGHA